MPELGHPTGTPALRAGDTLTSAGASLLWTAENETNYQGQLVYLAPLLPALGKKTGPGKYPSKANGPNVMNASARAAPLLYGTAAPPAASAPHASDVFVPVTDWEDETGAALWPAPGADLAAALDAKDGAAVDRVMARAHLLGRWDLLPGWYALVWQQLGGFFDDSTGAPLASSPNHPLLEAPHALALDLAPILEVAEAAEDLVGDDRWQARALAYWSHLAGTWGQLGFAAYRGTVPPIWWRPTVTYRPHWWRIPWSAAAWLEARRAEYLAAHVPPAGPDAASGLAQLALDSGYSWDCLYWFEAAPQLPSNHPQLYQCVGNPQGLAGAGSGNWRGPAPSSMIADDQVETLFDQVRDAATSYALGRYLADGAAVADPYAAMGHHEAENWLEGPSWFEVAGMAFVIVATAVVAQGAAGAVVGSFGTTVASSSTGQLLGSTLAAALQSGTTAEAFGGTFGQGFGAVFDDPAALLVDFASAGAVDLLDLDPATVELLDQLTTAALDGTADLSDLMALTDVLGGISDFLGDVNDALQPVQDLAGTIGGIIDAVNPGGGGSGGGFTPGIVPYEPTPAPAEGTSAAGDLPLGLASSPAPSGLALVALGALALVVLS